MTYKQLTYEERIILITLKQQGLSIREIGNQINRHASTIYRELKRNRCNGIDNAYRAFRKTEELLLGEGDQVGIVTTLKMIFYLLKNY